MLGRLKGVVVDDDKLMHEILADFYHGSDLMDIRYFFSSSKKFIAQAPKLDFDICLLDINMPYKDGLALAKRLKFKAVIFITGSIDKLKDALDLSPVDVVTKPFNKARLDHAIVKAQILFAGYIKYALMNVVESDRKVKITIPDIVFVSTDVHDPRNKRLMIKGGQVYTLKNYSLHELSDMAPHLVQANKSELVSMEAIDELQHDKLTLKKEFTGDNPFEITLSPLYSKDLKMRVFYK
ncbi:MAG TPA: response regulator [Bacteroidia bacterium]|nr:response regulator [Bacteroidia bacterium]